MPPVGGLDALVDSPLMSALKQFEATEANLAKAERLWSEVRSLIPNGIKFGENPAYEDKCRALSAIFDALPAIDKWKPQVVLFDLDDIAQRRLDANEIQEFEVAVSVEQSINAPGREIREYRYLFNMKRRELIRDSLAELVNQVDSDLAVIQSEIKRKRLKTEFSSLATKSLQEHRDQIDALLGSSVKRPPRWSDMGRHLAFSQVQDYSDIGAMDWPAIRTELTKTIYAENDPLPVEVQDLADVVTEKPRGAVTTKLRWGNLDEESFERIIFQLVTNAPGYENAQWLMRTNAPDRGRDISVYRVDNDPLSGTCRQRVIVQCRHWLSKSVGPKDIAELREQIKLWDDPRIDMLVIATSGRFTADAVALIEKHNAGDSALRIVMWPESHLENLLASCPALIAEFGLR